jgi:hypothetical protein
MQLSAMLKHTVISACATSTVSIRTHLLLHCYCNTVTCSYICCYIVIALYILNAFVYIYVHVCSNLLLHQAVDCYSYYTCHLQQTEAYTVCLVSIVVQKVI